MTRGERSATFRGGQCFALGGGWPPACPPKASRSFAGSPQKPVSFLVFEVCGATFLFLRRAVCTVIGRRGGVPTMAVLYGVYVIWGVAVLFSCFGIYSLWKVAKIRSGGVAEPVTEYRIKIDRSGEFPVLELVFLTDDGRTSRFRLVPKYAYSLSDEILRAVALASAATAPPKLVVS